ncbi:uncharacterized protein LOC135816812 [Sycon ciliatum]|uniref:uncharacterized protein LOC135816812 n=1 Tax=Sycon ciliatum TaxID=27933 RepID=UPI0031F6E1D9
MARALLFACLAALVLQLCHSKAQQDNSPFRPGFSGGAFGGAAEEAIGNAFAAIGDGVGNAGGDAAGGIGNAFFDVVGDGLGNAGVDAAGGIGNAFDAIGDGLVHPGFSGVFGGAAEEGIRNAFDAIGDGVGNAGGDAAGGIGNSFFDAFGDAFGAIGDGLGNIGDGTDVLDNGPTNSIQFNSATSVHARFGQVLTLLGSGCVAYIML